MEKASSQAQYKVPTEDHHGKERGGSGVHSGSSSHEPSNMRISLFGTPNISLAKEMVEKGFSPISYDAACENFMQEWVDKLIHVTEERIRQNKKLFDAIVALPPYTERADASALVWQEGRRLLQLLGGLRNFKRMNEEGRIAKQHALEELRKCM